jgi:hypothetical protein
MAAGRARGTSWAVLAWRRYERELENCLARGGAIKSRIWSVD